MNLHPLVHRVGGAIRRALKSSGLLIVEAVRGSGEGVAPKFYPDALTAAGRGPRRARKEKQ